MMSLPKSRHVWIILIMSQPLMWKLAVSNDVLKFQEDSPPPLALLALNDILRDHFPTSMKDLAFYVQAIDARTAAEQFYIMDRAVAELNGTRTIRIEQSTRITENMRNAKRILNVIIVDGLESFRYIK